MSDLQEALGESPEEIPVVEQQEPEAQEQAAEPETPEPEPEKVEPEKEAEPSVPLSVFKAMRDDLKGKMDQLAAQMPRPEPAKAPDLLEDPEAYQRFIEQRAQQSTVQSKLQMSRFFAEKEYGADAINEVMEYFNQHPQLSHQFIDEPSPFHAAKAFMDAQKTRQEIGDNPQAFKERMKAEIRKELEAEMAAKQAQEMAARSAPSLAGTNGSGGIQNPGWSGPTDLSSIIGE